jgi:hypothetical protein
MIGLFVGIFVALSQLPCCHDDPVSKAKARTYALKLGRRKLSCAKVGAYVTGSNEYSYYIAVVGCKKKVMFKCCNGSQHSGCEPATLENCCRASSDVMPGEELNVDHKVESTGCKVHDWKDVWELRP